MNGRPADEERQEIATALKALGLQLPGEALSLTALGGGVSCDVWRADLVSHSVCVKRALPKLRVEADWHAPAERKPSRIIFRSLKKRARRRPRNWPRLVAAMDQSPKPL